MAADRADAIAARDPALLGWHVAPGGLVAKRTRPVRDLLDELADLPENPAAVPWKARNLLGWRGDLRADAGLVRPAIRLRDAMDQRVKPQDGAALDSHKRR